jgi:hypothetical protein
MRSEQYPWSLTLNDEEVLRTLRKSHLESNSYLDQNLTYPEWFPGPLKDVPRDEATDCTLPNVSVT